MEMTWLETVQLLGLDLLVLMLAALVVLELVEQAVHSAWLTIRARLPGPPRNATARHLTIGGVRHV
jgi:ABC-type uncharacterized transport system YnjBCD permease subunit